MTLLITLLIIFVLIICYILSKIIFCQSYFQFCGEGFLKMFQNEVYIRNLFKKAHLVQLQAKYIFSSHNPSIYIVILYNYIKFNNGSDKIILLFLTGDLINLKLIFYDFIKYMFQINLMNISNGFNE